MAEASNQQGRRRRNSIRRRSGVWNHFASFKDDVGNDKARCNRCKQVLGASTRNGTSTLWMHVRICCRGDDQDAAPAPGHLQDRNASRDLARMIALRGYDPSFVEDGYFRSFVRSLNPEFEVPSRVAIEEMCDGIFDEARRDLSDRLRRCAGRFSLAVGKAKTPQAAGEVTYIACHFIDDEWKLHKLVLKALVDAAGGSRDVADGPILGVNVAYEAANYVIDSVIELEGRLSMVAHDITDNDAHAALKDYIEEASCSAHGNNPSWTTTTYVDSVLHSVARCLRPESDDFPISLYKYMLDLNLTRHERLQLLSELGLDCERAYDQPWCACYHSLQVLGKRGGLTGLVRADLQFEKLVCKVWEQVYRGIQRISASTCPTSNLCLAELLNLREVLQTEIATIGDQYGDNHNRVRYILSKASDTLNKALQDSYLIWSVPLALDPRYKLSYIEFSFKRAFGSEAGKYFTEVTAKISKLFADYIKEHGTITGADHSGIANAATASAGPLEQAWNEHCRSQGVMTSTQVNGCCPGTQTELDRYLQDRQAPAAEDFDLLSWWKVHSLQYPMVARMARDALAMPTCSKLSSDQLAQVGSILCGYSKKPFRAYTVS